jgi:hypothetical protein
MSTGTDFKFGKWEEFSLSGDFLVCLAALNIINWNDKNHPILHGILDQIVEQERESNCYVVSVDSRSKDE